MCVHYVCTCMSTPPLPSPHTHLLVPEGETRFDVLFQYSCHEWVVQVGEGGWGGGGGGRRGRGREALYPLRELGELFLINLGRGKPINTSEKKDWTL